jgi:phage regulator Rha-like protein
MEKSMSQLATTALTMSSSDIAELVESRHDHVKRSIERLAERGVIELPNGEVKITSISRYRFI